MLNRYRHNKTTWFGVATVVVLAVLWLTMNYHLQSSTSETTADDKIAKSIKEESGYKFVDTSESEILQEIKNRFPINAYELQIARQKNILENEFNRSDLVERITLERELTLLQVRIDNCQRYYDEKIMLLLEVFQSIRKFRNDFTSDEYNSAQLALINGDTELANRLLAKVDAKYRVTLGGTGIDRAAEAVYQQGKIAEENIDYRKAYQHYRQAVRYDPLNTEYLIDAGKIADSIALYGKAIVFYEAALSNLRKNKEKSPHETRQLLVKLGKTWSSKGEPEKAIEYFESALTNDIDTFGRMHLNVAEDYNHLGSAWESKGNKHQAKQHYRRAVKLYEAELGKNHLTTLSARENLERLM
ncbi:tetratricopeptide repeat protein [Kaarinaea lacus]